MNPNLDSLPKCLWLIKVQSLEFCLQNQSFESGSLTGIVPGNSCKDPKRNHLGQVTLTSVNCGFCVLLLMLLLSIPYFSFSSLDTLNLSFWGSMYRAWSVQIPLEIVCTFQTFLSSVQNFMSICGPQWA